MLLHCEWPRVTGEARKKEGAFASECDVVSITSHENSDRHGTALRSIIMCICLFTRTDRPSASRSVAQLTLLAASRARARSSSISIGATTPCVLSTPDQLHQADRDYI